MATQIKQVRDEEAECTVLLISGEMFQDDARLVARIAETVHEDTGDDIRIDIAELDLLDSEAAHILRELAANTHFTIEGTDTLLQTAIDEAERQTS